MNSGDADAKMEMKDLESPTKAKKPVQNLAAGRENEFTEAVSPNYYEVEEEEQQKWEKNMDLMLLGDQIPAALLNNDGSDMPEVSDSDFQSQNSQVYSQRSMPHFLQQLQNTVERKANAQPPGPNAEKQRNLTKI